MEEDQYMSSMEQGYLEEEKLIAEDFVISLYRALHTMALNKRRCARCHYTIMTDEILHDAKQLRAGSCHTNSIS